MIPACEFDPLREVLSLFAGNDNRHRAELLDGRVGNCSEAFRRPDSFGNRRIDVEHQPGFVPLYLFCPSFQIIRNTQQLGNSGRAESLHNLSKHFRHME